MWAARSRGINAFGVPGRCGKDDWYPSCSDMVQEAGSWMLYLQVTQVPVPSTLVHKLIPSNSRKQVSITFNILT
jgi:hypothetical protein